MNIKVMNLVKLKETNTNSDTVIIKIEVNIIVGIIDTRRIGRYGMLIGATEILLIFRLNDLNSSN